MLLETGLFLAVTPVFVMYFGFYAKFPFAASILH